MPTSTKQSAAAIADHGSMVTVVLAGVATMLIACLGLGGIFYSASYRQALALGTLTFNDEGFYQLSLTLSPEGYLGLRALLATGLMIGVISVGWLNYTTHPFGPLRTEVRLARAHMTRWWSRLPLTTQLISAGLLLLLVVVRTWYLLYYPLGTDEVASYDYFVHEGLLATTSYYPIPNNHIFYNLLAWPLAAAGLSPRLVMRLPTLVLGTIGSGITYALLARLIGMRRATLVTGLVGLAPTWVYYAAVGRGYFLQICLLQIGFFAVVELLRPSSIYRRFSWGAFVVSSILGFYTIPTYVYPFVGLILGLGGGLLLQSRWPDLRILLVAGTLIFIVVLLLYAPVMVVTGWPSLVANRYVAAKTAAQFWPPFRAVLYETAAGLFGPSLRISGPAWLAGALLGAVAVRRWVAAGPQQLLGFLSWVILAVPIPLMALQQVYAPLRTILYLTFFGYLLVALLLSTRNQLRGLPKQLRWPLVVGLIIAVGGYRIYQHQAQVRASRYETQQLEQAYRWLVEQPGSSSKPPRVWMNSPMHELFFAHYGIQQLQPQLQLFSGTNQGPRGHYDFVVTGNYYAKTARSFNPRYKPVYHDYLVTIYAAKP